jgi:hypothetical protein
MKKLVESVPPDCTVMTPLRAALPRLAAIVKPDAPVVLLELVAASVSQGAVVVTKDGQEFDPPDGLCQERVVDPPAAPKSVPLLELMLKRLLLHVPCACRRREPAQASNMTEAASRDRGFL